MSSRMPEIPGPLHSGKSWPQHRAGAWRCYVATVCDLRLCSQLNSVATAKATVCYVVTLCPVVDDNAQALPDRMFFSSRSKEPDREHARIRPAIDYSRQL